MRYFPKFNDRILIDEVGKYSISLPGVSYTIAQVIATATGSRDICITDATASVGGDTLTFAQFFRHVNAVERDPTRFQYLQHNIQLFGHTNVTFINSDYTKVFRDLKQTVVYMDPPWGGPSYKKKEKLRLRLGVMKLGILIRLIFEEKIASFVVLKLPYNYDLEEFQDFQIKVHVMRNITLVVITDPKRGTLR